ncbi:MAG: hypothetical protein ACE5DX_06140 [Candidatus Dojkabacteria bacterium]
MVVSLGSVFINEYIGYHLLQRSLTALEGHNQPIWFYLSVLSNWRVFVVWPLLLSAVTLAAKSQGKEFLRDISVIMVVLTVVGFSLAGTKLAWYILPVYPFAAILIGWLFHKVVRLESVLKFPVVIGGGALILIGVITNVIYVLSI